MVKVRKVKSYRHPELDRRIRTARIRTEARLAAEARRAGVRTPVVYDVDLSEASITMERIPGRTVRELLDDGDGPEDICRMIGRAVADLHNRGLTHGDLTTSNMMVDGDGRICLLDLSMGTSGATVEDMGVELHLLERAFVSAHPRLHGCYEALIDEYAGIKTDAQAVLGKVREIRDRGRYT